MLVSILGMAASSLAQISEGERLKARARAQGGKARVMVQGQMPTAPLEMVASEADLIVQGRISAVEPRFLDAEGMVVTYSTVTPTRIYKNAVGAGTARTPSVTAPIIFVAPGGTVYVDGLEISYVMESFVPDPPLQIGEEIIAFLKRRPDSNEFLLHYATFGLLRVNDNKVVAADKLVAKARPLEDDRLPAVQHRIEQLVKRVP